MKTCVMWRWRGDEEGYIINDLNLVKKIVQTQGDYILPDTDVDKITELNILYKYSRCSVEEFLEQRFIPFETADPFMEPEDVIIFSKEFDAFFNLKGDSYALGVTDVIVVNDEFVQWRDDDEESVKIEYNDEKHSAISDYTLYPINRINEKTALGQFLLIRDTEEPITVGRIMHSKFSSLCAVRGKTWKD